MRRFLVYLCALLLVFGLTTQANADTPEITSPAPGTTLPCGDVTFSWTSNQGVVVEKHRGGLAAETLDVRVIETFTHLLGYQVDLIAVDEQHAWIAYHLTPDP